MGDNDPIIWTSGDRGAGSHFRSGLAACLILGFIALCVVKFAIFLAPG